MEPPARRLSGSRAGYAGAMALPVAAERGFSLADPYALGLLFLGVAVFAAVGALSHQNERAFSASLVYLGLGLMASLAI